MPVEGDTSTKIAKVHPTKQELRILKEQKKAEKRNQETNLTEEFI